MPRSSQPEDVYQISLTRLGLSPRTLNSLAHAHIYRVGEVLEKSKVDLLGIRNFNDKTLAELRQKLADFGISESP
jgi:DNA-directed RNA polymerase alpha subunit